MSFNRTSLNLGSRRGLKLSLLAVLTMFVAFGALAASAVFKQRDATVDLKVRLCKKGSDGKWAVIDEANGAVSFSASVADVASGKEVGTSHVWNVRSQKGRQLSIRLQRAGKVNLNVTSGLLALDLPFEVSVDGKKTSFNTKLSTEQITTPIGSLSGKKAEINTSARTLTAAVAGFSVLKQRDLVDTLARVGEGGGALGKKGNAEDIRFEGGGAVGKKGDIRPEDRGGIGKKGDIRKSGTVGGSAGLVEELVVVIEGKGTAKARD